MGRARDVFDQQGDETNRGRLAGTFWGYFKISGIVGNFGSYFIVNSANETAKTGGGLYVIGLIMALVAALVFACLGQSINWLKQGRQASCWTTTALSHLEMCSLTPAHRWWT